MSNDDEHIEISFKSENSKKQSRSLPNGVKRSRAAFREDVAHSSDEDDGQKSMRFEQKDDGEVEIGKPTGKARLVIPSQKNRDWKEASRRNRQRTAAPVRNQEVDQAALEAAERAANDRVFGLNVMRRNAPEPSRDEPIQEATQPVAEGATPALERSLDEQAMDALLGRERVSTRVIPATSETDVFQDDFRSAPNTASLQAYAEMPVEEFGAAMLRGMGWQEGNGVGTSKAKKDKRTEPLKLRAAYLGIGAKSDAAVASEPGGWGRDSQRKDIIFNPVLLKDKKTGELFTEAELEQRKEKQQREELEREFERKERERDRRRHDRDDGDRRDDDRYDRHRSHGSSRRERSRDHDRDDKRRSKHREYDIPERSGRSDGHRRQERERRDDDKYDRRGIRRDDSGRDHHPSRHRSRR